MLSFSVISAALPDGISLHHSGLHIFP
jgi:hypothetical protein